MLNITLTEEARRALRILMEKEDGEACFRLREFVSGCGATCRSDVHRTLRVTLDGFEDGDLTADVDGIRFVMNDLLLAGYGNSFFISLDKNKIPAVISLRLLLK